MAEPEPWNSESARVAELCEAMKVSMQSNPCVVELRIRVKNVHKGAEPAELGLMSELKANR